MTDPFDEIREAATPELVALHNVLTMGAKCLRVGDTQHADTCLRVASVELRERGVPAVDGRLLTEVSV